MNTYNPSKREKHTFSFMPIIVVLFLISCSPLQNADRLAEKNKKIELFPDKPFDKEKAKSQLEKGTSTIRGVLFVKNNKLALVGGKTFGISKKIDLFPVTPYFMNWYNLRNEKENKKTSVFMSDEAYSMRLEAFTDEYGRFTFADMKPGKYFLQTFMSTSQTYSRDRVVGTNSYGTQYYQKEYYDKIKHHRIEKFVEINKDGEVLEVKLKD